MARGFRRKGSGENTRYAAQLDPLERATVAGLMDQVHDLLDPPAPCRRAVTTTSPRSSPGSGWA